MSPVGSLLFSLAVLDAEPSIAFGGWDCIPAVTLIVVILIVGFAIVAAAQAIKRDV